MRREEDSDREPNRVIQSTGKFELKFRALPRPDAVGQSEYRIVWDHINEMLENDTDMESIAASIGELAEVVESIQEILKQARE